MSFTRLYRSTDTINLTAPASSGNAAFLSWKKDGTVYSTNRVTSLSLSANTEMEAGYLPYSPGTCVYSPPDVSVVGTAIRFTGTASQDKVLISTEQITNGFVEFTIPSLGAGSAPNATDGLLLGLIKHSNIGAPCYGSQHFSWHRNISTGLGAAGYFGPVTGSHATVSATGAATIFKVDVTAGAVRFYKDGVLQANTDTVAEDVHLYVSLGTSGYVELTDSSFTFQP